MKPRLVFLAAVAAAALVASAQAQPAPAPAAPPAPILIKPVKSGVYMVTGAGGNVTVRTAEDGLIVVDGKNAGQANFDALMAQIRTVTDKPVRYVFNTHYHADHTGNNQRYINAGAAVIGHEGMKPLLAAYTPPAGAEKPAQPTVTYQSRYTVTLKGARAEGRHFGPAHTGGDTVVYFPDVKVVSLGDELTATGPNPDYNGGASLAGWIHSLDETLKLDFDAAIPGHGDNPMTKAQVKAFRDNLETLLTRARAQVKAGTPKDQLIAKLDLPSLGWTLPGPWALPGRLDGLYAEASK